MTYHLVVNRFSFFVFAFVQFYCIGKGTWRLNNDLKHYDFWFNRHFLKNREVFNVKTRQLESPLKKNVLSIFYSYIKKIVNIVTVTVVNTEWDILVRKKGGPCDEPMLFIACNCLIMLSFLFISILSWEWFAKLQHKYKVGKNIQFFEFWSWQVHSLAVPMHKYCEFMNVMGRFT